ncbi:MAG: hypothetical protein WA936_12355 [Erythrobacter sp.]
MIYRRILLFALPITGLALSGCVAAAIPLAAGGLVATGAGKATRQAGNESAIPAASSATNLAEPAPPTAELPAPSTGAARIARLDRETLPPGDRYAQPLTLADVSPEALAAGVVQVAPRGTGSFGGYDPFTPLFDYADLAYVENEAVRPSAILRDPASLKPDRAECEGGEPLVLIDLDPDGGLLDPAAPAVAAPALARHLERLRARRVTIAWISGHSAALAGEIRSALKDADLDGAGEDRLILMRYPEDRKQTRRRDLAASACVLAIAGDARSDFDELFEYVVNPASTAMLESLMGRGWFLIPTLFEPQGPRS